MRKLNEETYREIGKHFFTLATVFISVGLITPLFQEKDVSLFSIVLGFIFWLIFFSLGIYFVNRGSKHG